MINSNVFDYVNVLSKAADASALRNEVLSQNMSNIDTPGYKRQDVDFESQLRRALGNFRYKSVDAKVAHLSKTDMEEFIRTRRGFLTDWMGITLISIRKGRNLLLTRLNIMD